MEEISVFFYMTRKDIEQAIRQWLTKQGEERRISGLDLSPGDSEWLDGWFQCVWTNTVKKENWDTDDTVSDS